MLTYLSTHLKLFDTSDYTPNIQNAIVRRSQADFQDYSELQAFSLFNKNIALPTSYKVELFTWTLLSIYSYYFCHYNLLTSLALPYFPTALIFLLTANLLCYMNFTRPLPALPLPPTIEQ